MNKIDILLVCAALLFAFSLRGYNDQGNVGTLAIQPSANPVVAANNKTIGELVVSLERRAIWNSGMAKPLHAAPPMLKSYPSWSPPKRSPKPKPTK